MSYPLVMTKTDTLHPPSSGLGGVSVSLSLLHNTARFVVRDWRVTCARRYYITLLMLLQLPAQLRELL